EISVELPDQEEKHDVLATLWARSKVDDLMGQDMSGMQAGKMKDGVKMEITNLGLAYRMMTQFTSFVAVDENSPAGGIAPRRVDVPVESTSAATAGSVGNVGLGGISETVTVQAVSANMTAQSADFG